MSGIVCGQLKDPSQVTLGRESNKDKELIMSNQGSGNGGASPELQPIDPAPNDFTGQAPPVVALTSTSTVPAASQSSGPVPPEPDGVKIGHD
jgi:hypothetical protein